MFYKDKIVLLDEKDDIFLVRAKGKKIYLDHYMRGKDTVYKTIEEDYGKDFDVAYDYLGNKNIIYKNIENQLVLTTLGSDDANSIIVEESLANIYYLNIIVTDVLNIFYVEASEWKNVLNIVHLIIEGDKVIRNVIDTTENYEIVKPIQIRERDGNLMVFYYFQNIICLKMFNEGTGNWEKSITLTDNQSKLYLDTKISSDEIHLVYANLKDDQFYINYEKFSLEGDYIIKEKEMKISGYGNHTEPLLIRQNAILYIVWKETNVLHSISSDDNGETWGNIKEFPQVKRLDVVKYKYLNKSNLESSEIDYGYGSTDPIEFIGF